MKIETHRFWFGQGHWEDFAWSKTHDDIDEYPSWNFSSVDDRFHRLLLSSGEKNRIMISDHFQFNVCQIIPINRTNIWIERNFSFEKVRSSDEIRWISIFRRVSPVNKSIFQRIKNKMKITVFYFDWLIESFLIVHSRNRSQWKWFYSEKSSVIVTVVNKEFFTRLNRSSRFVKHIYVVLNW